MPLRYVADTSITIIPDPPPVAPSYGKLHDLTRRDNMAIEKEIVDRWGPSPEDLPDGRLPAFGYLDPELRYWHSASAPVIMYVPFFFCPHYDLVAIVAKGLDTFFREGGTYESLLRADNNSPIGPITNLTARTALVDAFRAAGENLDSAVILKGRSQMSASYQLHCGYYVGGRGTQVKLGINGENMLPQLNALFHENSLGNNSTKNEEDKASEAHLRKLSKIVRGSRFCGAGYYATSATNSTSEPRRCRRVEIGHYSVGGESAHATVCPRGSESLMPGAGNCTLCKPGTYANEIPGGPCLPCTPGTFTHESGSLECFRCSIGQYQSQSGAQSCESCPGQRSGQINGGQNALTTPLGEGSVSIDECKCRTDLLPVCSRGEILNFMQLRCEPCRNEGIQCLDPGTADAQRGRKLAVLDDEERADPSLATNQARICLREAIQNYNVVSHGYFYVFSFCASLLLTTRPTQRTIFCEDNSANYKINTTIRYIILGFVWL